MLQFAHNIEIPETVNPVQVVLTSSIGGTATIASDPSGLLHETRFEMVPGEKLVFYCEHNGPGHWTIYASCSEEGAVMLLHVFPVEVVE